MDNLDYIEDLYKQWINDPLGTDSAWQQYFATVLEKPPVQIALHEINNNSLEPYQKIEQSRVDSMIWAFRDIGYLYSKLNPLGDYTPDHSYLPHAIEGEFQKLTLDEFGIPAEDLDRLFFCGTAMKPSTAKLRTIVQAFQETYCSSIGAEFLHIQNKKIRRWLIDNMESTRNKPNFSTQERRTIMEDLIRTEELEHFLDSYFIGQKRFSLEGAEGLIPALHYLVNQAAEQGIKTVAIGTTHRGRLSILNTILNMSAEEIFSRFDENFLLGMFHGSGDVKYHIGYTTVHKNDNGTSVEINLSSNPSHLESVNAVVEGKTRAFQDALGDSSHKKIIPVLIHGDAAFSGQGVVSETLNLSHLPGFSTGGTIHIIINNQIGFTTPARSARSTFFPTDVAKMLPVPIFHVNGDNPESIVYVIDLAMRFRKEFGFDCIIDIFCYRRHGHNEGDEPSFTHPHMYKLIKNHPSVKTIHGDICDSNSIMTKQEQEKVREDYRLELKTALDKARSNPVSAGKTPQQGDWNNISFTYSHDTVATGVDEDKLMQIASHLTTIPAGFNINAKLRHIIEGKLQLLKEKSQVDWAFAESLAFGSLLLDNKGVRFTGQDTDRGTFSQRHLTWWDTENPVPNHYTPLNNLANATAEFMVYDSPLSEYSVLGFEYGYSLVNPNILVAWEAQFGDFSNGAQVVFDNFLACGESKWQHKSGLVVMLPHGNEGQGPDHSSGHLDRMLQSCAEENIQVCNVTTPAQYFHILRRQVLSPFRKPLILMTPKSLLRNPLVVSYVSDLVNKSFEPVIDDSWKLDKVSRILLCSGKVFYDLYHHRETNAKSNVALIRLEQLYPFPVAKLQTILSRYPDNPDVFWVQEEHKNFGAWSFVHEQMLTHFPKISLRYKGRPESASPAVGRLKQHRLEQDSLVSEAFTS